MNKVKLMKKLATFLFLVASQAIVSLAANAEECRDARTIIGASYQVFDRSAPAEGREVIVLRQSPSRVVYLMPARQLTQIYERYSETGVKLIEYFDAETIGVEHEVADFLPPRDWHSVYEVYPAAKLAGLSKLSESDYKCPKTQVFEGSTEGADLRLRYAVDTQLPVSIERRSGEQTEKWILNEFIDNREVLDAALNRVNDYRLYDFADLGDSEHEEFFRSSRYLQYKLGHRH